MALHRRRLKATRNPKEKKCVWNRKPSSKSIHNFSYLLVTVVHLVEHFHRLLEIVSPNIPLMNFYNKLEMKKKRNMQIWPFRSYVWENFVNRNIFSSQEKINRHSFGCVAASIEKKVFLHFSVISLISDKLWVFFQEKLSTH